MDKLGIIGNGFVGNAINQGMKNHFEILIHDKNEQISNNSMEEVCEADMIFICVPTPMTEQGEFDLSIIKDVVRQIVAPKILIVKSTITPEYAKVMVEQFPWHSFVFNPEFLSERTAVEDFQNPSRIVIGGNHKDSLEKVEKMYRVVFPSRLIEIIKTDTKTACFIKYFSNCFFAAKVSLMNEFRQIADASGVDWNTALSGLLTSGWVNPMHTLVPGPDGDYGFGGKCFPKDINAFIKYSEKLNVDSRLLRSAWEKNLEVRKNKNWLRIAGAVSKINGE